MAPAQLLQCPKVSDEVLRYMADHFAEALTSRHPDYARRLIQMVVAKAELYKVKLRLHYTPEILMETLTLSVAQGITGLWTVPPWESVPNPSYPLRVHELILEHRKRGQGSSYYCPKV